MSSRRDRNDGGVALYPQLTTWQKIKLAGGVAAGGLVAFACYRYKVALPHQYLVRTGLGVTDINIVKKGFHWPFQRMNVISMTPKNYSFEHKYMSREKMELVMPSVFTINPKDDVGDALVRYARRFNGTNESEQQTVILGILEGECRALASISTLEEIFTDRAIFREKLIKSVGEELDKFGLEITNANLQDLKDPPGSEYFKYLRQRTTSGAENQAKVDVADAKFRGDVGQKNKERDTRIQVAGFEAEAVVKENERKVTVAESTKELIVRKAQFDKESQIAQIESTKAAEVRAAELQKQVEEATQQQQTAALRAQLLSQATAQAESHVKEAEGSAAAVRIRAEAELYSQQQKAAGIQAVYEAQATGVQRVLGSLGGNVQGLLNYEMIQRGVFPELAKINAGAIQGLNPKITIWHTGSSGDGAPDYTDTIRKLGQCLPPLLSGIQEQTGMQMPFNWGQPGGVPNFDKKSSSKDKCETSGC